MRTTIVISLLFPLFAHASAAKLLDTSRALFKPLPERLEAKDNPITPAKVTLGRQLFFEKRLSKSQTLSCNSCHLLSQYGVDGQPTSPGHKGQRGDRNSPTVFNAGAHIAQFWDGRAATLEEQAKGPVLNPVEMAMMDAASVEKVLKSIPGYLPLFKAAFAADPQPITYDNVALAIGAFERTLVTPSRFDAFLMGDAAALTSAELEGLGKFVETGCATCHMGEGIGGGMYQKLGLVKPVPGVKDEGRAKLTKNDAERHVFKVPSLRNIEKTGPYLHDGSRKTLEETIALMGEHQLGKTLSASEVQSIATFLRALTGPLPKALIAEPKVLAGSASTPRPDPS